MWKPRQILLALLCLGMASSIYYDLHRRLFETSYADSEPYFDGIINKYSDGSNVFALFKDIPQSASATVPGIYFRANYLLYPHRMYVSTAVEPLNTAEAILAKNVLPSKDWLADHKVDWILTYSFKGNSFDDAGENIYPTDAFEKRGAGSTVKNGFWCIAYLLVIVLTGFAATFAIWGRRPINPAMMFGLSIVLGAGCMGLILIFASMCGLVPGAILIAIIGTTALAMLAILKLRGRVPDLRGQPNTARGGAGLWTIVALIALLIGIGIVVYDTCVITLYDWDAFAIWQYKAKVLATEPLSPKPAYFHDPTLSFSHLRYPLLMPMISAGVDGAIGRLDETLSKTPSLLLYIGLAALTFGALQTITGNEAALVCTAGLLTLRNMIETAGQGNAEISLLAFYTPSIIFLIRWIQSGEFPDLVLATLFTAMTAWTKNEGLAMAAINGVVLLVFMPRDKFRRNLIWTVEAIVLFLAIYLPWVFYSRGIPALDEDYASRLTMPHMREIPSTLMAFLSYGIEFNRWGIFWFIVIGLLVWRHRAIHQRSILALLALIILQLAVYVEIYLIAPQPPSVMLPVSAYRMLMHIAPAAILLIAMLLPLNSARRIAQSLPTP